MQNISVILLRGAIILIGVGALAFLLVTPHVEGRNVSSTFWEVYFNDPFLLGVYAASTAFFVALFKAFGLAGKIGRPELYSVCSLRALRAIRFSFLALILLIVGALGYLFIAVRGEDDIAGGVALGLFVTFWFGVAAISAFMFERHVRKKIA